MNNSRPFVPSFIREIDKNLLLKNPSVWSARTHLVLYFSFLFAVVLSLLCLVFYMDARQENNVWLLTGFVVIIAGIGFIFWLIYLLRFNVFKRFGNWESWDGLRTFLLYFLNVLVIVALPFIPSAIETFMANRQFTDAELVADVNELNINANLLEYDRLPKQWKADTFRVFKSTYEVVKPGDTIINSNLPVVTEYQSHYFNITDRELMSKIEYADSSLKVNDSIYIMFTIPDYIYVSVYNIESNKVLKKKEVYYNAIRNYREPDKNKLTARMDFLKTKYESNNYNYFDGDNYTESNDENAFQIYIQKKYKLRKIEACIQTIAEKKYRWDSGFSFLLHFMFYATLTLSLMVFIYRHTTKRSFFVSVLTGVILSIITSLFMALLGGNFKSFFVLMILYFIIFAVLGFTVSAVKTRTLVQGIGLNFFLLALPFMPLLITAFYYEIIMYGGYENRLYDYKMQHYFYAEMAGFILLLILIEPVFRKLYKIWYSLPEE